MAPTLLRNLDESVASHVLYTLMSLVHELKQFVHDCFEELPVRFQESRVLADDVHDVGSDDGLVVFAALQLDKPKQLFDDRYKKSFLRVLIFF